MDIGDIPSQLRSQFFHFLCTYLIILLNKGWRLIADEIDLGEATLSFPTYT